MQLLVVRHALTETNKLGIINGQFDDHISEEGRREIPQLLDKLQNYSFEAMYVSPLLRTRETAAPIAERYNVPLYVDPRIMEVNMGSFTQKPLAATIPIFGQDSPHVLSTYTYDLRPYGGESANQVQDRVSEFLAALKQESYTSVLIVTHGGIIRWLYYLCNGEKVHTFPNLSIHTFTL